MQRLDHGLHLVDPDIAVIGVGRVRTLGNVVVFRVIAPVELRIIAGSLVNRTVVIHRVDLNVVDSEVFEVIHAGLDIAGIIKSRFKLCEREVLAPVSIGNARFRVIRKVLDVNLPNLSLRRRINELMSVA